MGTNAYPLLTAMMSPRSAEEFLEHHWPTTVFAAHGAVERLPAMFRDPALRSASELAQRYTNGRLRFTHGASERMVQVADANPASLLDMGLTVQFVDVARVLPDAAPFLRQLQAELALHENATSISAFASPPHEGLSCHFDTAELISVQLAGTKRWHHAPVNEIRAPIGGQYAPGSVPFDELYPQASEGFPDPRTAKFESTLMEPGSVLFLPRGTWHSTEASGDSLSISIVVDPPAAVRCLLDQLRLVLLQDERWRMPLTSGNGTPHAVASRLAAQRLLASLPEAISRLTPEDLVTAPAGLASRLQRMTPASRFQRNPHCLIAVGPARADGLRTVQFEIGQTPPLTRGTGEVDVSEATVPILRWMEAQSRGPFAASALLAAFPGLAFADLKPVLEICVQTQLIRLLWFPELAVSH